MKLNFKTFKKIAEDEHHTTLQAPEGHTIKVAHKALHPATRGQLASLPMTKAADAAVAKMGNMKPAMAKGGKVTPPPQFSNPTQPNKTPATDMSTADGGSVPEPDKKKAAEMQQGALSGGTSASDAWKNLKSGLGYAEGGEAGSPADVAAKAEARANAKRDASLAEPSAQSKAIAEPGYTSPKQGSGNPTTPYVSPEQKEQGYGEMVKGGTRAGKVDERLADGGEVSPDQQIEQIPETFSNPNTEAVPQASPNQQIEAMPPQAAAQPPQQQTPPMETAGPQPSSPQEFAGPKNDPNNPYTLPPAQANDPMGVGTSQALVQKGVESKLGGLGDEQTAQQAQYKTNEGIYHRQAQQAQQRQNDYNTHLQALNDERTQMLSDIKNQHIDPNHYMNSLGTEGRVATAIGLIAAGMGGGMMGHGGNLAADFLHKQIDNDINAQKSELGKKENLLSANLSQFKNLRDATEMTRIMQTDIVANKLNEAAAQAGSPLAAARLKQAAGDFMINQGPALGQLAMRQSIMSGVNRGEIPPEKFALMLPKDQAEPFMKEIKEARDANSLRDSTLGDYEKLAKLSTLGNYAGSPLQTSRQVAAIKGAALDKLTKDISGRVTPETVHLIGGIFNTLGSDEKTQAVQFKKLNELLSNGMHYPHLTQYNFDPMTMGSRDKTGHSKIIKAPITPLQTR